MSNDKWTWDKDDVEWEVVPAPPGTKPLIAKEDVAIIRENLRRIRAGEPLLDGTPTKPQKDER